MTTCMSVQWTVNYCKVYVMVRCTGSLCPCLLSMEVCEDNPGLY